MMRMRVRKRKDEAPGGTTKMRRDAGLSGTITAALASVSLACG